MTTSSSVLRRRSRGGVAARLTCLVVAVVTLATGAVAATTAQAVVPPTASGPAVPHLEWTDCGDGFECATARVPLDYDRPQGKTIVFRLSRLPAADPSRRIGSLFLNPGGPGGSGVDFVRDIGPFLFSDEVRARFDLVGFDPRGIRRSTALRCFGSLEEMFSVLPPFPFPYTRAEERVWEHSDRLLANACTKHAGAIINHMSTANVVRDMDLLRQAVGDAQLTYAGYSYGSYLGNTYANMFPGKVRALILDAVVDPIGWSTGRGNEARTLPAFTRLHNDKSAYETLQQFFALCDRGGENCPFSGGAEARYRNLARGLLEHPVELINGVVIHYADLVSVTLDALYQPQSWPFLAKALARLERRSGRVAATAAVRDLRTQLGTGDKYQNLVEGQPGVVCADTDNPSSPEAWSVAARAADREFGYFGRPWTWLTSICAKWPGEDQDRFTGPFTQRTANPVLLIGNRYDPATPYQGAVTVANLIPRAGLLTLDGWGHTSLFQSACIDNYASRYLLTSLLPPKGTVCQPDVVPFAEPLPALTPTDVRPSRSAVIPSIRAAMSGR
jgi:pimeloyl-ACP methyl ester carboxylesterase